MTSEAVQGQQLPESAGSEFNALAFLVSQMISRANIATMVKVLAVSNDGGVAPIGTMDVQIMVNQVDGAGKAVPHVTVYGLPYMRVQGGANAIILDPQVGDIGAAMFAHSDISGVKATQDFSNPSSGRRNSISDGIYCFTVLSAVPSQYVRFSTTGIEVLSPTRIDLTAPIVVVTASNSMTVNAINAMTVNTKALDLEASVSATLNSPTNTIEGGGTSIDGKAFLPHTHGGVVTGGAHTTGVT